MPEETTTTSERRHVGALERVSVELERRAPAERLGQRPPTREPTSPTAAPPAVVATAASPVKTPLREDVEAVLADGLDGIYGSLPSDAQERFRVHGERLAERLEGVLASGKLVIRQVHQWIVEWLQLIPHRAKSFTYFLVQEAKVKTDAILAISTRLHGDAP